MTLGRGNGIFDQFFLEYLLIKKGGEHFKLILHGVIDQTLVNSLHRLLK